MAGFDPLELAHQRIAEQCEVSQRVQHLVPDQLVAPAQAGLVDDALRVIAESMDYICAERLTPNLVWLASSVRPTDLFHSREQ